MERLDSKHNTLFFHMGPGLHSRIEAQKFSDLFPHVAFLDQPQGKSFAELVDWTCEVIEAQHTLTKKPLILLGHSFGGHLIAAALSQLGSKASSRVAEIKLMNSAFDPFDCFANLQKYLLPQQAQGPAFWKQRSTEEKLAMIYSIAENPQMAAAYWHAPSHQEEYQKLSSQHPALNLGTFVKVFTEFLNEKPQGKYATWSGPVQIFYSKEDHLIQHAAIVEEWKKVFPAAEIMEVKNVGHYGHFESAQLAAQFFVTSR